MLPPKQIKKKYIPVYIYIYMHLNSNTKYLQFKTSLDEFCMKVAKTCLKLTTSNNYTVGAVNSMEVLYL